MPEGNQKESAVGLYKPIRLIFHGLKFLLFIFASTLVCFVSSIMHSIFFSFDFLIPKTFQKLHGDLFFIVSQSPTLLLSLWRYKNIYFYYDQDIDQKSAILVSNHQSAVDWMAVDYLLNKFGRVPFIRAVIKMSLFHIPICGFGLFNRGYVPVYRRKNKGDDCGLLKKCMENLISYSDDFIMAIFAEGTRRNPTISKIKSSSDEGWERLGGKYKPTNWVSFPKSGGFDTIRITCGDKLKTILDVTVMYKKHKGESKEFDKFMSPTLFEYINDPNIEIHVLCKHYKAEQFEGESPLTIYDIFQLKDQTMEKFYKEGPNSLGLPPTQYKPGCLSCLGSFLFVLSYLIVFAMMGFKMTFVLIFLLYTTCQIKYQIEYKKYI
ncbi:putative 1-acyl-sn-glycerol-3-phosphate acyltransferase 4 [Thelohanellus kitauei]|uniref:Putative 1-acyl-sn-glycerol-3-phosphate acyltransferase 4 n=1 Tax=Thelohanellus kitauei TaxID=669202 RepID=A0A0C2M9R9_THEKT|nr:putative 1-acyl-sn-glycerol-3-phosphate acyltransferase 4 [Thelohanellus kitauei]